jgi:hypothetical protein
MAAPPKIRVNTAVPFPAQVTATAPISISKVNGVWVIGMAAALGIQNPPANPASDYILLWDSIVKTLVMSPISSVVNAAQPTRTQRSIVNGGGLPLVNGDQIINLNAVSDLAPVLPAAAARLGVPLTIKNLVTSVLQTVGITGLDRIDGQTSIPLPPNASITFNPFNDGVNSGWTVL